MHTKFISLIAACAALTFAYGCAPATLGDTTRLGNPPKTILIKTEYSELWTHSKANVVSKGENLDVKITMENGDVCSANLKLKDMVKSWPVLSAISFGALSSEAYLEYSGNWGSDMSASCLKLIQAPGGTYLKATVGEYHTLYGGRALGLVTKMKPEDLDIEAKSGITYYVPVVEGVDD